MNHMHLDALRARFNPALGLITGHVYGVGYHTRLPGHAPAHPYRENAVHAFAFLSSDLPVDQALGRKLLTRVLAGQNTDPASPWYGLWSWFAEESLTEMNPADWNWADFLGSSLLEIIVRVPDRLDAELLTASREALGHAAWSIFRRNVTLDYTNIAVLGTAVTLAAGHALNEPRLTSYGQSRLRALRHHIEARGVGEYNSPNYYLGDIGDLERLLALPLTEDLRSDANSLLRLFWQQIAHHFHPPTGQWAGPHSRAYTDWISAKAATFLEARLGFPLPGKRQPAEGKNPNAPVLGLTDAHTVEAPLIACSADLRPRFQRLPPTPFEHREVWTRTAAGHPRLISTTWMTETIAFGSINHGLAWNQCQPVVAYWRGPSESYGRLRVRVLLEGRDFASAQIRSSQSGPSLLGAVDFSPKEGTYHPHFDKPADGVFHMRDLRLRFEFCGSTAHAAPADERSPRWRLAAAGGSFILNPGPGWFDGQPVTRWEAGGEGDLAWVDAIFHAGEAHAFHPEKSGTTLLSFALAWQADSAPSAILHPITLERAGDYHEARIELDGQPALALTIPFPANRS